MQGRIKKVTTTYYNPNGEISHSDTLYYPEIKYKFIGWCKSYFGWSSFEGARRFLIAKLGNKIEEVEYIDVF